jgi:lipid II:glycine glycyltransferase (peptidoglycan interpeptide bridge formation enzyme)
MEELDDSLMTNFKCAFLNFLADGKYVSVFSRMHPFFNQQLLLEKFGGVHENGRTVVIDLSESIEDQRKKYRQSTLDSVKHAWKKGFKVREEKGAKAIALFNDIYTDTMKRVNASDYYFFSNEYFEKILNTPEYDGRLLTMYDGDTAICSTIIMFTNGIIQAHLIGTRNEYLHHSPAKFMADEISILGRSLGMRYYNLGGGLGFKEDALFKWKLGFTEHCLDYKSWRYIANPTIYQELLDKKDLDKNADIDFFPLYRYA